MCIRDSRLGVERHVADLVEEDRPLVRRLEAADPPCVGARERALLVSEELTLDEISADRRAVDRDERTARARARLVDRLRDELFSGSALAPHEHRQVGLRDLLDLREHVAHRRARADHGPEPVVPTDALEQHPVLPREAGAIERAGDDEAHLVVVERLRNVVLGARLHRLHGDLLRSVCRDEDHGRIGVRFLRGAQHVHTGRRSAERQVRDDEVERGVAELADCLLSAVGLLHVEAEAPQEPAERELDGALVLCDEHRCV